MTDNNIIKIKNCYQKANDIKTTWNTFYDEVYKFTIPFRGTAIDNNKKDGEYSKTDREIFNSVGQQAGVSFVNRIQQILSPIDSDFIGMEAGNFYKGQEMSTLEINKYLENVCEILNTTKAISNFDSAISEFYFDLIAGTACLLCQPGTPTEPVIFKTIPFKDYCILEGSNGKVDSIFRKLKLKVEEIESVFKEINKPTKENQIYKNNLEEIKKNKKDKEEIQLLESCMFNYEKQKWEYFVIYEELNFILVKREYQVNPFIILRWNKSSSDYYGQGPGLIALNDLKTFNKIMKDSMSMLAFSLPIILTDSDDVFADDFSFEPLTVNKTKFTNGKPQVQQLDIRTDINTQQFHLDQFQVSINKTMLANTLPNDPAKMTAYEIQQRIAEQQVDFTSVFGRLIREFLYELPKVMLQILQDYFEILTDFNIDKINGFNIKIRIKTPLARLNKENEINKTMQSIQMLAQLDPSGSLLKRHLNLDNMIIDLLENIGVKKENIKTIEEIEFEEQQQAMMIQAQHQQAMQNQVDMQGAIDVNKAQAQEEV